MWRFTYEQVKSILGVYTSIYDERTRAINSIEKSITKNNEKIRTLESEILVLESKITNVDKTISDINIILKKFNFNGFSLGKGDTDRTYKIIRANGNDAGETLSEGEYTFITFLYFYHLINGSTDP